VAFKAASSECRKTVIHADECGAYARGPKATIVHVFLSPSKAHRVTGADWGSGRGLSPRGAVDAGYDVYVVSPYEDGPMWIALDPAIVQIARIKRVTQRGGVARR
jgi:hypothetical protein